MKYSSHNQLATSQLNPFLGSASLTALAWITVFQLNTYLFENAALTEYVSWIFLPAAVRILAVLLLGYAGATGLFLGALLTNKPIIGENLTHSIVLSLLSAAGPVGAVILVIAVFKLSKDLTGLRWWHLFVLALVGAVFNVIPTQTYLHLIGLSEDFLGNVGPMLLGDTLGTITMLMVASYSAKFATRLH